MADIVIRLGVNAPQEDANAVLKVLEYVYQQPPEDDDKPFRFEAYEDDFSDGSIGAMASMSFILNYKDQNGTDKQHFEHLLQSFARNTYDGKSIVSVVISPVARKLNRVIHEQRNREADEIERSNYVQKMAESLNLS